MYGLTECQRVCYLPPDQLDARPDVGRQPDPGNRGLGRGRGRQLPAPGEVGELIVRGAHVMQGYWNDPEATRPSCAPGRWPWERVLGHGDLFRARRGRHPPLRRPPRRHDQVPGREGRAARGRGGLHAPCGVREAAVVGVPDRLLGQAVHAHVALEPGHELDPRALRRALRRAARGPQGPPQVVVHDELPRTDNGKLDRRALAEAVRSLGRMTSLDELQALERRYTMPTYACGGEFVRGEGARLWDSEGKEYLDFFSGLSVHNAGHCHPRIVAAITEQAARFNGSSNLFLSEPALRLAERISESSLGGKVFSDQLRRRGVGVRDQARPEARPRPWH